MRANGPEKVYYFDYPTCFRKASTQLGFDPMSFIRISLNINFLAPGGALRQLWNPGQTLTDS
ncbi:MAG: hypothetical protein QNK18_18100 [Gammaproteobacteria bacterium]|nr:hypothetical protein [Gammaproteobacteria bacterium]